MPNRYPEETNAIYCTNVNGSDENVMCFTSLDVDTLRAAYEAAGTVTWDEMYVVPPGDVRFYCYDPAWLTVKEENRAKELAAGKVIPA